MREGGPARDCASRVRTPAEHLAGARGTFRLRLDEMKPDLIPASGEPEDRPQLVTHARARAHTHGHARAHTQSTHRRTHRHTRLRTRACTDTLGCAHTYTRVHTQAHTDTHTHRQSTHRHMHAHAGAQVHTLLSLVGNNATRHSRMNKKMSRLLQAKSAGSWFPVISPMEPSRD